MATPLHAVKTASGRRPVSVARRPRKPMVPIQQQFHAFLHNWAVATDAGKDRDRARDAIKAWFAKGGGAEHEVTVNDNGSLQLLFDEPMEIAGRKILGLENRRSTSSTIDPDLIDEYLETLPQAKREAISKKIIKPVTDYVLDTDALMALNQDGTIPDEVLDGFYQTSETFSLNVLKV